MSFTISYIKALEDNYIWIIIKDGYAVILDPGESKQVIAMLDSNNLQPAAILITHHHFDHVGGVRELQDLYQIPVYAPEFNYEFSYIKAEPKFNISGLEFTCIELPGHTKEHVGYMLENNLFCGDTLFSAGCGRVFTGTIKQLYESINKISELPNTTMLYPAHEYTRNNLEFALSIEPDNVHIAKHIAKVKNLLQTNSPSLPTNLKLEKDINPFLRTKHINSDITDPFKLFSMLRHKKDGY